MMEVLDEPLRQRMHLQHAQYQCSRWRQQLARSHPDFDGCPPDFDGVECWPPARRSSAANGSCPPFLPEPAGAAPVTRWCGPAGAWEDADPTGYEACGLDEDQLAGLRTQEATPAAPGADVRFLLRLLHECYAKKQQPPPAYVTKDVSRYCPITFDGWTCWDYTPAGRTAYNPCPYFIVGFDPRRSAFRVCLENGTWFQHPESNRSWSNYTTCVDMEDLQFRQLVNQLYVVGYSVSFAALLLSLLIFFSFRSLRCTRIAIHVQLFLSFAANNLMWLVWYRHVLADLRVLEENWWGCRALHVLLQYLMVANYMWMFCEGLHLHLALVVVFVKDELVMRWFYFVGWGLPAAVAGVYAYLRALRPEDSAQWVLRTDQELLAEFSLVSCDKIGDRPHERDSAKRSWCWMNESVTQWVLTAPVLLSLAASAVFLANVLRVLLTKLHSNSANPAPVGVRKAARAALILVPLFGLQHVLLPFRPEQHARGERLYQVCSAVLISLQGFCVSCLFCFANVDVHGAVRPLFRRLCPCLAGGRAAGAAGCDSGPLGAGHTGTQSRDVCV